MSFQSHSQAGQDRFVYEVCGHKTDGTFLDVGCGDPEAYNNTIGLEQIGWRGRLLDRYEDPKRQPARSNPCFIGDATKAETWNLMLVHMPPLIDYLSLDCDENSYAALAAIPFDYVGFGVITVEHDRYLRGDDLARAQRDLLKAKGYVLICADVHWEGGAFEDWYVTGASKYHQNAVRFACDNKMGRDIVTPA